MSGNTQRICHSFPHHSQQCVCVCARVLTCLQSQDALQVKVVHPNVNLTQGGELSIRLTPSAASRPAAAIASARSSTARTFERSSSDMLSHSRRASRRNSGGVACGLALCSVSSTDARREYL
jgi:hypothetical protein